MKILACVLCHQDIPRVDRAVRSTGKHGIVVSNSRNSQFAQEAEKVADIYNVPHYDFGFSGSNVSNGKQACFDVFRKGDADYLLLVDGDDFLYSTWHEAISDYLRRCPCLDALLVLTLDRITDFWPHGSHVWQITPNRWASIWADFKAWDAEFFGWELGPGRSKIWRTPEFIPTPAMPRLFSRRCVELVRWRDEAEGYPDDHLMCLDLLATHQRGSLFVGTSMRSDFYVIDATLPESDQKTKGDFTEEWGKFHITASSIVDPDRSTLGELPTFWPQQGSGMVSAQHKMTEITAGVLKVAD